MRVILTIPIILLACSLAGASFAQSRTPSGEFIRGADLNNDGALSLQEFNALREPIFRRLDANGDGRLVVSELRAAAQGRDGEALRAALGDGGGGNRGEALRRLREIDLNGDRALDLGEFRAAGQRRFQQLDVNRNGLLERQEFETLRASRGED